MDEVDVVKTRILAIFRPHKEFISTEEVSNEYRSSNGNEIPFTKLGYSSVDELLKDIAGVVPLSRDGKNTLYRLISTGEEEQAEEIKKEPLDEDEEPWEIYDEENEENEQHQQLDADEKEMDVDFMRIDEDSEEEWNSSDYQTDDDEEMEELEDEEQIEEKFDPEKEDYEDDDGSLRISDIEEEGSREDSVMRDVKTEEVDVKEWRDDVVAEPKKQEPYQRMKPVRRADHSGKARGLFVCPVIGCIPSFRRYEELENHMTKTHLGGELFSCNVCMNSFDSMDDVMVHIKEYKDRDLPLKCCGCERECVSYHKLLDHVRCHTGERPYACEYCVKTFKKSSEWSAHMKGHTREGLHRCDECGKEFKLRTLWRLHMRKHTGERPFKCAHCPQAFSVKHAMKRHVVRAHTDPQDMPRCEKCGRIFTDKYYLERHLANHPEEKTYVCGECGRILKTAAGMRSHEKSHRRVKEEKEPVIKERETFKCGWCGREFKLRKRWMDHEKRHAAGDDMKRKRKKKTQQKRKRPKKGRQKKSFLVVRLDSDRAVAEELKEFVKQRKLTYRISTDIALLYLFMTSAKEGRGVKVKEDSSDASKKSPLFLVARLFSDENSVKLLELTEKETIDCVVSADTRVLFAFMTSRPAVNNSGSEDEGRLERRIKEFVVFKNREDPNTVKAAEIVLWPSLVHVDEFRAMKMIDEDVVNWMDYQGGVEYKEASSPLFPSKTATWLFECPIVGCSFASSQFAPLDAHLQEHDETMDDEQPKGLFCDVCLRQFHSIAEAKKHIYEYRAQRPLLCCACSFGCFDDDEEPSASHLLLRHFSTDHTTNKRLLNFGCTHCDRTFVTEDGLRVHFKQQHMWEQRFACGRCGLCYVQRDELLRHMRDDHLECSEGHRASGY